MIDIEFLAAAANEALANEFYPSDNSQWWIDMLASALTGLSILPFALLLAWSFHKFSLNRWPIVTAALATILATFFLGGVHELVYPIFIFLDQILRMIGVNQFMIYLMPNLVVCFAGSLGLSWWLWRRSRRELAETLE